MANTNNKNVLKITLGILIFLFTIAGAIAIPTNNLVSEYTFENGTSIGQDTGNAGNTGINTGTLTNTTLLVGNAVTGFSDSNYIYIPDDDSLDITQAISVCMIRNNPVTDDWDTSVMRYSTTGSQRVWNVQTTAGEYQGFTLGNPDGSSQLQTDGQAGSSPYGTYFFCGTWNTTQTNATGTAGVGKIYINGTEINSYYHQQNNSYTLTPTQTVQITIGRSNYSTGRYDRGSLDEITIWNKSLSSTEVNELYEHYLDGYHASEPRITIDNTFDSASLENYTQTGENQFTLQFQEDQPSCTGYDQCTGWAFFKINNATTGDNIQLHFDNYETTSGGYWTQSLAKPYISCDITDDTSWTRTGTTKTQSGANVYLNITAPCQDFYVSSWLPYWIGRTDDIITQLNTTENQTYTNITMIGTTVDGRNLYGIIITNESKQDTNKMSILFTGGLHASETLGDIMTEGILKALMNTTDPDIANFLNSYKIYIAPNINRDGLAEGYNRYNPEGYDPNRCFDDTDCQEVNYVKTWLLSLNASMPNKIVAIDNHGNGGAFSIPTLLQGGFNTTLLNNIATRTTIDNSQSSTGTSYNTAKGYMANILKYPASATLEYTQTSTRTYKQVEGDAYGLIKAILDTYGTVYTETAPDIDELKTFTVTEILTGDELTESIVQIDGLTYTHWNNNLINISTTYETGYCSGGTFTTFGNNPFDRNLSTEGAWTSNCQEMTAELQKDFTEQRITYAYINARATATSSWKQIDLMGYKDGDWETYETWFAGTSDPATLTGIDTVYINDNLTALKVRITTGCKTGGCTAYKTAGITEFSFTNNTRTWNITQGIYNFTTITDGYIDKIEEITITNSTSYTITDIYNTILKLYFKKGISNTEITNISGTITQVESGYIYNYTNATTQPLSLYWLKGNTTIFATSDIDGLGTNKTSNLTTNVTYNEQSIITYLYPDALTLYFYQNSNPKTVSGFVTDSTNKVWGFNDTSILIVREDLAEGKIRVEFNNLYNWTQYFEYINNGTAIIDEDIEIINASTNLDYKYLKVIDYTNSPVSNAIIRATYTIPEINQTKTANLLGQRLTNEQGLTFFVAEQNAEVLFTVYKEGYEPVEVGISFGDEEYTKDSPLIIRIKQDSNTVKANAWLYLPIKFTDRTQDIHGRMKAIDYDTVELTTNYRLSQGLPLKDVTNSITWIDSHYFTLEAGTDFATTGNDNITVYIYLNSEYWGQATIRYQSDEPEEELFNESVLQGQDSALIEILGLLVLVAVMGLIFKDVRVGFHTFMVGLMVLTAINPTIFFWLGFISLLYYLGLIVKMIIGGE